MKTKKKIKMKKTTSLNSTVCYESCGIRLFQAEVHWTQLIGFRQIDNILTLRIAQS